jgi:glucosamine--fructose-6-phosphate aminotransferase (isomerizing)
LKGSYAFALMDATEPDVIYVAKNKSPLLIGLGDGYNMVCSDAMAMIRETSEFMEIHDHELVILTQNAVEIHDLEGNILSRDSYTAELDLSDIGKEHLSTCLKKSMNNQLLCVNLAKSMQMSQVMSK